MHAKLAESMASMLMMPDDLMLVTYAYAWDELIGQIGQIT